MAREYTKVKHLESTVFELKAAGKTNAQIGDELGLTKAQIKGLIKRYNRNQVSAAGREETFLPRIKPPANRAAIRTQGEMGIELNRLTQEVDELEQTLQEINRMWSKIEKARKAADHNSVSL